jgi:DNA-binding transcriptional MerR regulator
MELKTIGAVSRDMGISARMLRYYEQVGLIRSLRRPGYAYRVYDEEALRRLRQILVMRKLRIPVRQIERVLRHPDAGTAIDIFRENVEALSAEIDALSAVREALIRLIALLERAAGEPLGAAMISDASVAGLLESISPPERQLKEERFMERLDRAEKKLEALREVRIVYLPPMTVAAYHHMGEDSEMHASEVVARFVLESGLLKVKPDLRHFGFNNPIQHTCNVPSSGYEMWVSIPDDFPVPEPLTRKRFLGGLYAAHAIEFGAFDHWGLLADWVARSDQYRADYESVRCEPFDDTMDRCLEEQLNYIHNVQNPAFDIARMQLDLLMPIR